MYRVLVTDGMDKDAIKELSKCCEVVEEFYESNILGENLKNFDVVVVRSKTKIRKEHLDIAKNGNLKLIIRAGVGIDNIDHEYAKFIGIDVRNTPSASSLSVAELVISHMFSLARFVPASKLTMAKGEWNKKQYKGTELRGKTLGIIGFGRIGQELARIAIGIGMEVIYTDTMDPKHNIKAKKVDKETLIKDSDFISLNLPKLPEPVLNLDDMKKMKPTAYIINCARGGLVKESDILYALDNGIIAGYGVDVFETEPTDNLALAQHEKVSITPHIGAQTAEAQKRVGFEVVEIIKKHFGV